MEIIDTANRERWNCLIQSFEQWDIYFTYEYNAALMLHGDGQPLLIYYEEQGARIAYVMFQNDIAESRAFRHLLETGRYYDWTSPYGYGGPLTEGQITHDVLERFRAELFSYCAGHHIVSQFFRFHPLLHNHRLFTDICEMKSLKKTVAIDTLDYEAIDQNMTSECRNRVRKAEKNAVEVLYDRGERLDEFLRIYYMTMQHHQADAYYYFKKEYFTYLIENMNDHLIFFYARKDGEIISAAIFLYSDRYMHYHLGGTTIEGRKYAPFNLLLRSAARWANQNGMRALHLGGGTEAEDTLYRFKRNFCPQGAADFYIGRTIFDQSAFDELVGLRKKHDSSFRADVPFMITYRAMEENADMQTCVTDSVRGGA